MSTRSIVGVLSPEGKEIGVGVYVHSDGYPEGRLPYLKKYIVRDGVEVVATTILSANTGGWSYLFDDYSDNNLGHVRAEVVAGYGLKYLDAPKGAPMLHSEALKDWGIEYAYYLDLATGDIVWYEMNGTSNPKANREVWSEYAPVVSTKLAEEAMGINLSPSE